MSKAPSGWKANDRSPDECGPPPRPAPRSGFRSRLGGDIGIRRGEECGGEWKPNLGEVRYVFGNLSNPAELGSHSAPHRGAAKWWWCGRCVPDAASAAAVVEVEVGVEDNRPTSSRRLSSRQELVAYDSRRWRRRLGGGWSDGGKPTSARSRSNAYANGVVVSLARAYS
jgi:hypothetical protein